MLGVQPVVRLMPRRLLASWQRWSLWGLLAVLVVGILATLVWLAGRHEVSQVQGQLDRDTADAVVDLRSALNRNVQTLQAMQARNPLLIPYPLDGSRTPAT